MPHGRAGRYTATAVALRGRPPVRRPSTPPVDRSIDRRVLGGVAVGFGSGWLLMEVGALPINWQTLVAAVLVLLGVGMVVTARQRAGHGARLVVTGVLLVSMLAAMSWSPKLDLDAGAGDALYTTLQPSYKHGAGELTIDLSGVSGLDATRRTINASLGVGRMLVVLPEGVDADIDTTVGVGAAELFGRRGRRDFRDPDAKLRLRLRVGMGQIEVIRGS